MGAPWKAYKGTTEKKPWESFSAPASEPEQSSLLRTGDILHNAVGSISEPIAKFASGMVAKPFSDVSGLVKGGLDAVRQGVFGNGQNGMNAQEMKDYVQNALTYAPRTEAGKSDYNPLNAIPNAVAAGINLLQPDAATGEDSTTMAGMLRNGIREFIPQVIGIAGVKSAAPVTKTVKTVTTPVVNTVAARFGSQPAITERASAALKSAAEGNEPFAIKAMDNAKTFVPGATPTMAEAIAGAQEPNSIQGGRLVALQRSMRGAKGVEDIIPSAEQAQKAALEGSLAPYAGDANSIATAKELRRTGAGAQYKALDSVTVPADATLETILNAPSIQKLLPLANEIAGNEAAVAASQGKSSVPFHIPKKAAPVTDFSNEWMANKGTTPGRYSIGTLQYIKAAIDKAATDKTLAGSLGVDANSLVAKGGVRDALTQWMEKASPEWAAARQAYADQSVPINQLQVNQALANKLTNTSDALTPSQFLTAADTGEAALLKKSGIPRYAGGLSDVLTPENMATVEGIANHLGRTQKAQQMSAAVQTGTESALPPIPHVGGKAIILDSIRRAINGKNVNTAVAQAMTDPAKVAELLRMPKGNTPGTFGPLGLGVQFVPQPDQKALAAQLRKQQ